MSAEKEPDLFFVCFIAVLIICAVIGTIGSAVWAVDFLFNVCGVVK